MKGKIILKLFFPLGFQTQEKFEHLLNESVPESVSLYFLHTPIWRQVGDGSSIEKMKLPFITFERNPIMGHFLRNVIEWGKYGGGEASNGLPNMTKISEMIDVRTF